MENIFFFLNETELLTDDLKNQNKKVYISIEKEKYFKDRIKDQNWELEYSKRVKEEKYHYYKENIKEKGDQWIETDKIPVICTICGEKIEGL